MTKWYFGSPAKAALGLSTSGSSGDGLEQLQGAAGLGAASSHKADLRKIVLITNPSSWSPAIAQNSEIFSLCARKFPSFTLEGNLRVPKAKEGSSRKALPFVSHDFKPCPEEPGEPNPPRCPGRERLPTVNRGR